jgi:hypothetical protein
MPTKLAVLIAATLVLILAVLTVIAVLLATKTTPVVACSPTSMFPPSVTCTTS